MKNLTMLLLIILTVSCGKQEEQITFDNYPTNTSGLKWKDIESGKTKVIHIPNEMAAEYRVAIENAGQKWNDALGFTAVSFVYGQVENRQPVDNTQKSSLFFTLKDNLLAFYKQESWNWLETSSTNTIASTVILSQRGYITEADILFNFKTYNFCDAENNQNSSCIDMESVIIHELGHFLGLGHSSYDEDPHSVMATSIGFMEAKRELSENDISKIRDLYLTE